VARVLDGKAQHRAARLVAERIVPAHPSKLRLQEVDAEADGVGGAAARRVERAHGHYGVLAVCCVLRADGAPRLEESSGVLRAVLIHADPDARLGPRGKRVPGGDLLGIGSDRRVVAIVVHLVPVILVDSGCGAPQSVARLPHAAAKGGPQAGQIVDHRHRAEPVQPRNLAICSGDARSAQPRLLPRTLDGLPRAHALLPRTKGVP